jgi:hypothetical protein
VRERSPGFIAEDVRELLETELDVLRGLIVVGEVGAVAPYLLDRQIVVSLPAQHQHDNST